MLPVRAGRAFQRPGGPLVQPSNPLYILSLRSVKRSSIQMPSEIKNAQVNLRLTPSLKAAAEKAAAADHRSLTSLIEKLLSDHLRDTAAEPKAKRG